MLVDRNSYYAGRICHVDVVCIFSSVAFNLLSLGSDTGMGIWSWRYGIWGKGYCWREDGQYGGSVGGACHNLKYSNVPIGTQNCWLRVVSGHDGSFFLPLRGYPDISGRHDVRFTLRRTNEGFLDYDYVILKNPNHPSPTHVDDILFSAP